MQDDAKKKERERERKKTEKERGMRPGRKVIKGVWMEQFKKNNPIHKSLSTVNNPR